MGILKKIMIAVISAFILFQFSLSIQYKTESTSNHSKTTKQELTINANFTNH